VRSRRALRPGPHGAGGFTLVEIIVTLALVATLLMVVVPSLDGAAPGARLRSGARMVAATVRWLRSEAVSRGRPMGLRYDAAAHRLVVLPDIDRDEMDRETVDFPPRPLPEDVRIVEVEVEGEIGGRRDEATVRFDPRGRVQRHAVVLALEDRTPLRVSVHPLTGGVRIEEADEVYAP
jgi:type II secretion system protein H